MHDQRVAVLNQEWALAQPVHKHRRVGLRKHLIQRVAGVQLGEAFLRHHEKEIVVAEYAVGRPGVGQRFDPAQDAG